MKPLKIFYTLAVLISTIGPWQLINCFPLKASRITTINNEDSSSERQHMRLVKRSVQVSQNGKLKYFRIIIFCPDLVNRSALTVVLKYSI